MKETMKIHKLITCLLVLTLPFTISGCNKTYIEEDETINEEDSKVLDLATNPNELLSLINSKRNYSINIRYDVLYSLNTISIDDYQDLQSGVATESQWDNYYALFDDLTIDYAYKYDLYVDDSYMMIFCYSSRDGLSYNLTYMYLLINNELGGHYQYNEGASGINKLTRDNSWEDRNYSLFNTELIDIDNLFTYSYSGIYESLSYDAYTLNNKNDANAYYFVMLGTEWIFSTSAFTYALYNYMHDLTYFFQDSQEMVSTYYYDVLAYTDSSRTSLRLERDALYFDIYDVGTTEKWDEVNSYIDYFECMLR